jgi:putative SOS response-associated peptidase YedK
MCGRYALYDTSKSEFKIAHNLIGKNYNITPSTTVPIVVDNNEVKLVSWTFKVPWADKLNIINARSETLITKKVFLNAKRCIFIANGYFEWLRQDKVKIPYYHTFKDQMMYFGGIFNDQGACIVTRQSYPMKVKVHHRQPVILRYDEFESWFALDHDYTCKHTEDMDIFEVSNRVNSSKNNALSNIERI